ncbi:hypothetical protein HNQ59_001449 [Chitinivorax tropicus]|uniref:Uncharacterized protein n=1 Tax=Chitinivorax tropicus TaxID=714531 RepID=A0A840MFY9_9PROT|nr:hypothetical protein [Chitinivorax tropicus]MBB5018164.1 hypothetical protein [Chitinivorax tropicus]
MIESSDFIKTREIRFAPWPPEQTRQAAQLLCHLPTLEIISHPAGYRLIVQYSLHHHCLAEIEAWLLQLGFHLDGSLTMRLKRALITYCEQVQRDNLQCPERLIKKPKEIHIHIWQHHAHGDHDATPEEWRKYR